MDESLTNLEAAELVSRYFHGHIDIREVRRRIGLPKPTEGVMGIGKVEGFTENTLFKVYNVFLKSGLTHERTWDLITELQNEGILFREIIGTSETYRQLKTQSDRIPGLGLANRLHNQPD